MKNETKADKECPNATCAHGRIFNALGGFHGNCPDCKGLGKIFSAGDSLTAHEADHFTQDDRLQVCASWIGQWAPFPKGITPSKLTKGSFLFRLAPAPSDKPDVDYAKALTGKSREEISEMFGDKPAVESVGEKITEIGYLALKWEIVGTNAFARCGARKMADWLLSLSPAALEELRRGK